MSQIGQPVKMCQCVAGPRFDLLTNLRHMSKVRPMTAPSHYDDGLDDLTDDPTEYDPDPPGDDEPGHFGPELDYAYDPGRGEHMAGWG